MEFPEVIIMKGRLLLLEPTSVAKYMALSEAFQTAAAKNYTPTVFISPGWTDKAVSIGYEQPIEVVNLQACEEDGVAVVRRPTKDYALPHDPTDSAYGIVLSRESAKSKRAFDDIVLSAIVETLEHVGVPGAYDPLPKRYGNVYVRGKKIAGSAQNTDNRKAWLQHGLIAMRKHIEQDHARYINDRKSAKVTSVEEEGGDANTYHFALTMAEVFISNLFGLGIHLDYADLSDMESELAGQLLKTKYEREEWVHAVSRQVNASDRVSCFVDS